MQRAILTAALLVMASPALAIDQNCTGRLYLSQAADRTWIGGENAHELVFDRESKQAKTTWCDAQLTGKELRKVLKVCAVGDDCRIKGEVHGHGTFSWTKIISVKRLGRSPGADDADTTGESK